MTHGGIEIGSPIGCSRPGRGWWKLPATAGLLLGVSYLPGPFLVLNFTAFLPLLYWLEAHPAADRHSRATAGYHHRPAPRY